MKLTQAIRKEFVDAVMFDIKTGVDNEKISAMVMAEALAKLPPEILLIWENKTLRPYLSHTSVGFDGAWQTNERMAERNVRARSVSAPCIGHLFGASELLKTRVATMLKDEAARLEEKWLMGSRLTAMAATCKTHAALRIMFPDLTQYIPDEEPAFPSYPVPAVVMDTFMSDLKKLGVPGKKVAATV